jgi:hypothetical protein
MVGILKGTSQKVLLNLNNKPAPIARTRHVVVVSESTDMETLIADHRSVHRFIKNLLHDAHVSALETNLIQDNATILAKAASLSARVARDRLALRGRDHFIITKEISRWESYPLEVDNPIVVSKPKKANNGCVPQRRAKRRSGLESPGEIKAGILKKTESMPRRPRRRSSVVTDTTQKSNMQHELLSLFLVDDDDSVSLSGSVSVASNSSVTNASKPKRDVSPHRWATMPKKPIRRLSEVPDDIVPPSAITSAPSTTNAASSSATESASATAGSSLLSYLGNRPPTKSKQLVDFRSDSVHSLNSIESTLSDVARRQSDLSSISEQATEAVATLTENRRLNCSVILEEDEHEQHENQDQNLRTSPSDDNAIKSPRKPMRRVSDAPEDLEKPPPWSSDASIAHERISTTNPVPRLTVIESPSTNSESRERLMFVDTDDEDGQDSDDDDNDDDHRHASFPSLIASLNDHTSSARRTSGEDKPKIARSVSNPVTRREGNERNMGQSEFMPKKPMRRLSEAPRSSLNDGVSDGQQEQEQRGASPAKPSEAQHSFSTTESTASETTVSSDVTTEDTQQPTELYSLECEVIPEEEGDVETRNPA